MKKNQRYPESSDSDQSEQEEYGKSKSKGTGSKRGPKPIDPRWTRVIKFKPNSDDPIQVYSYIKDANLFFVDSDTEEEDSL